jgi:hypothetical protein
MILRTVTKHVKDQNWFAVVIDLAIVIFGVYIGIQVSNWNENLVQEQKTTVLVKRLYEDLADEREVIAGRMDYIAVVKKFGVTAVRAFNNAGLVNDESFVIAAYQASQIDGVWSYRSAYDELVRTGNINLIKDENLKDYILGYYSADLADQNGVSEIYREYIRGVIPYEIQYAIRNECGDIAVPVAQTFANAPLPETCDLQLNNELFSESAIYLRSQPEMLHKLQHQLSVNDINIYNYVNYDKTIQKLMKKIEEYQQ